MAAHDDLEHLLRLQTRERVLREEDHADAVGARRAEILDPGFQRRLAHKPVRDLHHETHAVAGLAAGVAPGAVLQLLHDLERVVHRAVRLLAADADHRADAAGVVLKGRIVERIALVSAALHKRTSRFLDRLQ